MLETSGGSGPRRSAYVRGPVELLADVAATAANPGDLRAVLDRLAGLAMEATGADRASFFLVDQDRQALELWAAVTTRHPDDELWELGRSLPVIPLDGPRRAMLAGDDPVAIVDAAASTLVPAAWTDAFQLASLVVAPLRSGGKPLGALVLDYRERRVPTTDELWMVGAVARSGAMAVANASLAAALAQRADNLKRLLDVTRALVSPRSLGEVAELAADAIADVLHARHLSVHLLDPDRRTYRTLVQRGTGFPDRGRLVDLPRAALRRVATAWRRGAADPVVVTNLDDAGRQRFGLPAWLGTGVVLPLVRPSGEVFGFVLLGLDQDAPVSGATLDLAAALAAHVAFAVDRAQLHEQIAVGAEFARALLRMDELDEVERPDLVSSLRDVVPAALGFEVVDVRIARPSPSRPARSQWRDDAERQLWASWRSRRTRPDVVVDDDHVHAPVWGEGRVLGILRARALRGSLAPHERDLLEALATALGDIVERREIREAVRRRERDLALAEERAEAADVLHVSVGRLLATLAARADEVTRTAASASDAAATRRIAELARAGLAALSASAEDLGRLRFDPRGLEATITDVVSGLADRIDAAADVTITGEPRPLAVEVERALVRVVHEAIARLADGGRASALVVRLAFTPKQVELILRDDGLRLGDREAGVVPSAHFGLRLMQRRLAAVGGTLDVEPGDPRGLCIRAVVPA